MDGSLHGRVIDDLGAVVPGVTVRICDLGKVTCELTTDDCGLYQSPGLRPGIYDLAFLLQGMTPTWRTEVGVRPGERHPVNDVVLKPSGTTERVTVYAPSGAGKEKQP